MVTRHTCQPYQDAVGSSVFGTCLICHPLPHHHNRWLSRCLREIHQTRALRTRQEWNSKVPKQEIRYRPRVMKMKNVRWKHSIKIERTRLTNPFCGGLETTKWWTDRLQPIRHPSSLFTSIWTRKISLYEVVRGASLVKSGFYESLFAVPRNSNQ